MSLNTAAIERITSVAVDLYALPIEVRNRLKSGMTLSIGHVIDILNVLADGQAYTNYEIADRIGVNAKDTTELLNALKRSALPFSQAGGGRGKPSIWQLPPY